MILALSESKKSVKKNDCKDMLSFETWVEHLDKPMHGEHAGLVTQSWKEQEVAVDIKPSFSMIYKRA